MQIHISENFNATAMFDIIGYLGETNARAIEVKHPVVEGADTYRLRFEYSDGVVYDVPIIDGKVVVTGSLLREVGNIFCQWLATKSNGETYDLVAKSQIFSLEVKQSIGDDVAPIPPYEQSLDMLDKLNKGISSKITEPETEGTDGQVLVTDGNGGRYWQTVQGGGSGGEDGFSPTIEVAENTDTSYKLSITDKNGTITTPNLKGADGKQGTGGLSDGLKNALKTYFTNMQLLLSQLAYTSENHIGNTLIQNANDIVSALNSEPITPDEPDTPIEPDTDISQSGSVLTILGGVTATQTGTVLAIA